MTDQLRPPKSKAADTSKDDSWRQRLLSFGGVAGFLGAMTVMYLGYDLIKAKTSPCDSIFQQTAVGLTTKIKFLETEGELQIGRDKLAELGERAQMTALNLKTCCTVLDAGRLNPEQFIQCKSKARSYETQVKEIVTLIKPIQTATAGTADAATAAPATKPEVDKKVTAAITISKEFNHQLVEIRKAQVLETLEATTPQHVDVGAKENEPNDNLLTTNRLKLGGWITGSIGAAKDADIFSFTTPDTHRDWITVELQNRSTTLYPQMQLFNSEKTSVVNHYKTTPGSDLKFNFVAPPKTTYFVSVSDYYGKYAGVYLLAIKANKSYDSFEPNEGILQAKALKRGTPIEAAIMDGGDNDYFVLKEGSSAGKITVRLENTSTTLHPMIAIYGPNKAGLHSTYSTTAGADLELTFDAVADKKYFIRVYDYYGKGNGSYRLNASAK